MPDAALTTRAHDFLRDNASRFQAGGDWEPVPGTTGFVFPSTITELGSGVENAAKKAALYGTYSRFHTPFEATMFNLGGEEDSTGMPPVSFSFDEGFAEFLGPLLPYVVDGCIDVLPTWKVGGVDWGTLPYKLNCKGVLEIGLSKKYLVDQLTESAGAVRILLPHLSGTSPERILEVRNTEKTALGDFHNALYGLASANVEDGDQALYEWMLHVDENVRALNDRMTKLAKKRRFQGRTAAVSQFPFVLGLAAPPSVQALVHSVTGLLGATSALSYVSSLRDMKEAREGVAQSPFYVPWLLQSDSG
ncbi:MAG TPA: hypothetical protein VGO14_00655 [Solirubrobacteraceae bacterium]|jgi:hypothetical protein|nr:hypothetical protein [Solirubrobacteraceae bacterium]